MKRSEYNISVRMDELISNFSFHREKLSDNENFKYLQRQMNLNSLLGKEKIQIDILDINMWRFSNIKETDLVEISFVVKSSVIMFIFMKYKYN